MGWGGPDKGEQSLASLAPNPFAAFLLCCSFWSLISIGCGFHHCLGVLRAHRQGGCILPLSSLFFLLFKLFLNEVKDFALGNASTKP